MPPRHSTAAILLLAATAIAQCPPGAPMPSDLSIETTMPEPGAAATRWALGRAALQANDFATARQHLLGALEFHPASTVLLLDLALASRDDKDLGPLWSERLVRAAGDAQGRVKWDAAAKKQMATAAGFEATLKVPQELALLRAAAIAEVARFVDKNKAAAKGNGQRAVLVRWASELLLDLGVGAPQALAAVAPTVQKTQNAFLPDHDLLVAALARVMAKKPAKDAAPTTGTAGGDDAARLADQRVRAARILVGLRRQGSQKDLQGPIAQDVGKAADDAQRLLDEQLAQNVQAGKVWSIAELEAMAPPDAERFTQQHRHWHAPGIALSTTGRYRIETICGHQTLLETAKTVELHHVRLVDHYGSDPFKDRQGFVRIVPEVTDLETEGAPFWWAGGFQAGDRTTIIFAWSDIVSLGRTLTHELTHRFDGVLKPFLGSWYGEGHASWTGAHYGRMAETKFTENYLDRGGPAHTWYKGYGDRNKFEQLLKGEIEEYRDNYFAGYSLYAFLRDYPHKAPRYRDALATYEKNARGGSKDPVGYFTATFCDGKNGRPAKFDDLFTDWQKFLRDCYEFGDERTRNDKNAWVGQYGGLAPEGASMVMDEPTWSWDRVRAEPFYGQGHAAEATLLLHEVGDAEGTIAAGVWSTKVDGWRRDTSEALLAALRAQKATDAAAAFAATAARHFPSLGGGEATTLLAAHGKCKQLLDALAARSEQLAATSPDAGAATAMERNRLAQLFGLAAAPLAKTPPAPLPRHLGGHGYTESSLTNFDERRHKGLWYATPDGDLHVGREKPRDTTGTLDRAAHQRDAFVHTVAWQAPGQYVLRGRVHFTTSFASGAIVFGHMRRDRDLRLGFSTGDFDYATGRSEKNAGVGKVSFHLAGLWQRDGRLPSTAPGEEVGQPGDQGWFDYELHVNGPRVLVVLNGEPRFRYAAHDGTPIEGHVGFAVGMGAIRVQQPTVQRLDGTDTGTTGLDFAKQQPGVLEDFLLLPVQGLPRQPSGTMVLWLPQVAEGEQLDVDRAIPTLAKLLHTPHEHPQPWVLAVPKSMPAAERTAITESLRSVREGPLPVVEHQVGKPFDGRYPWVLFVDGDGVLREAAAANDPKLHGNVSRWSRYFRPR